MRSSAQNKFTAVGRLVGQVLNRLYVGRFGGRGHFIWAAGETNTVGGCDSDGGRTADHQTLDRIVRLFDRFANQFGQFAGQFGLVDQDQTAVFKSERFGSIHGWMIIRVAAGRVYGGNVYRGWPCQTGHLWDKVDLGFTPDRIH